MSHIRKGALFWKTYENVSNFPEKYVVMLYMQASFYNALTYKLPGFPLVGTVVDENKMNEVRE